MIIVTCGVRRVVISVVLNYFMCIYDCDSRMRGDRQFSSAGRYNLKISHGIDTRPNYRK